MSDKVTTLDFGKFHNTIAGKSRDSSKIHNGINPSDKTKLWDVPIATEHDLDDAVKSGQEAFKKWSKTTWKARQDILLQMVEELLSHRDEMAQLILKECGKPVQ
jgi:acyl-CoA reductase-like NAD-dependent aldehyde dehydrogenase